MGDTPCTLVRALGLKRHRAAPTHPRPHADRQPRALSYMAMALEIAPRWPTQGRRGVRVGHWGVLHAACTTWELPKSAASRHMCPRNVSFSALLAGSYCTFLLHLNGTKGGVKTIRSAPWLDLKVPEGRELSSRAGWRLKSNQGARRIFLSRYLSHLGEKGIHL